MPKHEKKSTTKQNLEFQKKAFPARITAAKKRAKAALAADKAVGKSSKPLSVEERGRHQRALKAAERVETRMGLSKPPTPKKKPKTKGDAAARRRAPVERFTGTGKIKQALEGVNELITAGRRARKGG